MIFLEKKISERREDGYTREIKMLVMGELMKRHPLSDKVLFSRAIAVLRENLSKIIESNSYTRVVAIEALEKVLEEYVLPREEIPWILDYLIDNSMDAPRSLKDRVQQMMVQLLLKNFVSNPEKQRVAFKVAGRLTSENEFIRAKAVGILHEFVVKIFYQTLMI